MSTWSANEKFPSRTLVNLSSTANSCVVTIVKRVQFWRNITDL